jgi:hypothetical protein
MLGGRWREAKGTMDIKQAVEGAVATWQSLAQSLGSRLPLLITAAVVAGLVWLLVTSRFWTRLTKALEDTVFSNWRLALLGTTGVVLSLASGWTTWDGMWNFTCGQAQTADKATACFGAGVLSLMITFGIQGVMLIVAWLIGESFATGMNQRSHGMSGRWDLVVTGLFALLTVVAAALWVGRASDRHDIVAASWFDSTTAHAIQNYSLFGALAALLIAFVIAIHKSDIGFGYVQSFRVIVKNAALWLMFLSCMATSVFFSFDSLFTAIFPQEERVRAAELRAQNQVAGILADIHQTIDDRRTSEREELFKSKGWTHYDDQLTHLAKQAVGSSREIEKFFNDQLEDRNRAVKEQQERITTAQSGEAGLNSKKTALTDELTRLEGERPTLAAEHAQKQSDLDARAKEVDAKRVEAMAEDKGVEGTGKVGRGPVYRQRMEELSKLNDYYKIGEERVKDAKKRLDASTSRIAQIKRELAVIDGDLAKYKGESETAQQRIKLSQEAIAGDDHAQRVDPARALPAFEAARGEFRQDPTPEKLAKVQQHCTHILNAMLSTKVTKPKVAGVDCDPKQVAEAAAPIFALVSGTEVFARRCLGGDKLEENKTADALFGFSRKCLADSGLPSKDTDKLRTRINFIELNRDDKAHRFVVTWNAFQDGNRLAYLALAIAIAIDGLVFMSGLFGANAVRSPLSDVPSVKARSAQQLEAIIENALLPDTFDNARAALAAMRPISNLAGFMAEVRADRLDPHTADRVMAVLNAGATIHAVEYDDERDRWLVRAELFEFLSIVARKAFEASPHHGSVAELEKVLLVALLPNIDRAADAVLQHLHPIKEREGFTSEIFMQEVDRDDRELAKAVRNALNAGSTLQFIQRDDRKGEEDRYYVHRDFYKALARIRARTLMNSASYTNPQLGAPSGSGGAIAGGRLDGAPPQLGYSGNAAPLPPPLPKAAARKTYSADEIEFLRSKYFGELLAGVGVQHANVAHLLTGEAGEAASDAWEALKSHCDQNPTLRHVLQDFQKDQDRRLETVYGDLAEEAGGDETKAQLLSDMFHQVRECLPTLMLLPELGLLNFLLENLEAAAAPDNGQRPGEQVLRDRLARVRNALRDADTGDEHEWRRIEAELLSHDDLPNVIRPRGMNPRYN